MNNVFTAQMIKNASSAYLVEQTLASGFGKLSKAGSLCVWTGEKTGRSPKDKFVVESSYVNERIDWDNDVNKMDGETFNLLKTDIINHINESNTVYHSTRSVGALAKYAMNVELYTTHPSFNLFFNNMFRNENKDAAIENFTVIHAPTFEADTTKHKTVSKTAVCINFEQREVLVCGTKYAGEIKKSIFSVMNFILPEMGVLPMHSGASLSANGQSSVFFGLSGTGKTTLSTDQGVTLIGDDEHGLCEDGVFNFEGGCYAKTIKLSAETEPEIFRVSNLFGSMLENVKLDDETREVDFFDTSLTENGRSSYSLDLIDDKIESGIGPIPRNIFFLAADAYGVLPPIAKLNQEEAKYYFLLGYTAKVAGTEVGLKEPTAAFSTCFGAPFMMRKPADYAKLLGQWLAKENINVWLVNTGWTGGPYGEGERFPLSVTRTIIRAIQKDSLAGVNFVKHEATGLNIPTAIDGVDSKLLTPDQTWSDSDRYLAQAKKLNEMMQEKFKKFQ